MTVRYDMVVIGGGSGGLFAASVAHALGAKTCLIEKNRLGGDCTWYGCMPSKSLIKSAAVADYYRNFARFGLGAVATAGVRSHEVMAHVRSIREAIGEHEKPAVFEKRGITVMIGAPEFVDPATLAVAGQRVEFKRCVIATGSHPLVPPIEGLSDCEYLTNETVFELTALPDSLIVLGGGPIGVELAQALGRLGVTVTVVEMTERILFREDPEVVAYVEKKLRQEGITLLTGAKAVKCSRKDGGVAVTLEYQDNTRQDISAARVLVASGRAANVSGLALEQAGVGYSAKGIAADAFLRTANNNIFVCGDVVGPYQFSHVAAYQASVAVRNALFRRLAWARVNYGNVPWATFTEPELARVGFTEAEAKAKLGGIRVYRTAYADADRAKTDVATEGLLKVITDKQGYVVGAHVVGAQAGEIIQGLLIAKSLRIKLERLGQILFIYPTLSELVKKTAAQALVQKMDNPLVKMLIACLKRRN